MFLVCFLALDEATIPAMQQRLGMSDLPMQLVTAHSAPELIGQVQSLPVKAVVIDAAWPRATWEQVTAALQQTHPQLARFALVRDATDFPWWQYAEDLLRLDDTLELFLHRLQHAARQPQGNTPMADNALATISLMSSVAEVPSVADTGSLLVNPQFRKFAEIFVESDVPSLLEAFVSWVQQACQVTRTALLLRDPVTGTFACHAYRGLPSTLIPHCVFAQTSSLCRWLAASGRILLKEALTGAAAHEIAAGLDLMQAVAAVPILRDGQLVGILGIGPRLVGLGHSAVELEALYALAGQVAIAIQHRQVHQALQRQRELTEQMLSVLPTGTLVVRPDHTIGFVNAAAAELLGKPVALLQEKDLRQLPSPLGDMAYETMERRVDLPRREIVLAQANRTVAISTYALKTTPPSAMLLLEDLTARKQLEEEHGRRVDLEVVTNVVHYLAHELRNPLVALATFGSLVPQRAGDPEFQEFCQSVLQPEIARVNLIIEQLLVLTNHVELHRQNSAISPVLERLATIDGLENRVMLGLPTELPIIYADTQRLETAMLCILRTMSRMANPQTPITVKGMVEDARLVLQVEAPVAHRIAPEVLVNPWQQFFDTADEDVDLGLATAHYIMEQHNGSLSINMSDGVLVVTCQLPIETEQEHHEEGWHEQQSTHRR